MEVANTDRKVNAALIGSAGEAHAVQVAGTREFIEMLSSNLYSRPKEAMIREVICNADDAHKDAGYDGPIEISIDEDNTLIIRDRGKGIPHNKMHIIYGTYGGSTKKTDKNATGGFGLGCKSPWSYTDAFNVTNAHGGTKTISTMLRVSPDHGGLPAIVPIASFDTDETGLEVRIDLKINDVREITGLIQRIVYRGGMKATFNGNELPCINYGSEATYHFERNSDLGHQLMVKYGSVLYPVDRQDIYGEYYNALTTYISRNATLILLAPSDSLVISPNRENVSYLEKTQKQLWMLMTEFMREINRRAVPYARKLIRESNEEYIKREGNKWMSRLNTANYLDSPRITAGYHSMDVFTQVIHNKLTYEYPHDMHKETLKHRFSLTRDTLKSHWDKKLLNILEKLVINDPDLGMHSRRAYHTGSTPNQFIRAIIRELTSIWLRQGWDLDKLRFAVSGMYFGGRSTVQPQLVSEISKMGGDGMHEQQIMLSAPVILSHTILGATESKCYNYFAFIIPRNGHGALNPADVEKTLQKYGITVINLTQDQKLTKTAKAKVDGYSWPTIGNMKKLNKTGNNGRPVFNEIGLVPKIDQCANPRAFIKIALRSNSYSSVDAPVDLDYERDYWALQTLMPDDTAVVTTEADVKRLVKMGAKSWREWIYEEIVKIWADPVVRRAYAWSPPSRDGGDVRKYFASDWYKKTFDLPDIEYSNEVVKKLMLLSSYLGSEWEMHKGKFRIPDRMSLSKAIDTVTKAEVLPKIAAIRQLNQQNALLRAGRHTFDIDEIVKLHNTSADPIVVDKTSRILSIIME